MIAPSTALSSQSLAYGASGKAEYDELYPAESKPLLGEMDAVLAEHYGFTRGAGFIVNYDIKYCLGRGSEQINKE